MRTPLRDTHPVAASPHHEAFWLFVWRHAEKADGAQGAASGADLRKAPVRENPERGVSFATIYVSDNGSRGHVQGATTHVKAVGAGKPGAIAVSDGVDGESPLSSDEWVEPGHGRIVLLSKCVGNMKRGQFANPPCAPAGRCVYSFLAARPSRAAGEP